MNLIVSTDRVCPTCSVNIRNPYIKYDVLSEHEFRILSDGGFLPRVCPSCSEEVTIFSNGCVVLGFPDGEETERNWIDSEGTKRSIANKITNRTCRYREQVEVRKRWHQGCSTHQIRKETGIPLERVEKLCRGFLKKS